MQSFHNAFKKLCKARAFELLDLYYANTHQKRSETELEELAKQLLGNDYLILCNSNKRDAERLLDIYNQLEESDLSSVLFLLLLSNTASKVKEISFSNSFKHGFDISYPSDLFESRIYYEIQEDTKLFGVDLHGSDCNSILTKVLSLPPLKYPTLFAEESDCTVTGIQDISSIDSAYNSDSNIWDNTFILKPMVKNFISWEKGETEYSPSMSKFITECSMTTFQQLYYNYNLPLSKDVIYIPETLLIKKVLLLCDGVQSDIFPFDEKFTCKYSSIVTDGTTVKSIGSFIEKYFRFGNNIRSIAKFIAVLQDKANSTSSALAEGIQVFLKIVEHNLIEIETDGGVHLLGLDLLLHPMELLVDFLAKFLNTMSATIESSTNASVYLNLIYQEMLTVEKLCEGTKMFSLLKYLFDLASKPLFTWLECWLTQSSNDQIDTFDPHNEFFISGNKQYGYELKEDLLPSFITLELAREIYSMGITWRQVNNNFIDYNSNVFIKWELRPDKIEKYEFLTQISPRSQIPTT
ncbi:hypothetical protein HDV04_003469 [Boothiomyces sp. JEL0838]|nr:hypothetical protein HDV04_003469 [Boothiomyces sp. JEL0838]